MKLKRMAAVFMATLMTAVPAFAQDVRVAINQNIVDFPNQDPVIQEGRTLIPLRGVFDNLGYSIDWDGENKVVTLSKDGKDIVVKIGEATYTVGGEERTLDVPAQIINGSTMLPFRAIGEATGLEVLWDAESKIATIVSVKDIATTIDDTKQVLLYTQEEQDYLNKFNDAVKVFEGIEAQYQEVMQMANGSEVTPELFERCVQIMADINTKTKQMKNMLTGINVPSRFSNVHNTTMKLADDLIEMSDLVVGLSDGSVTPDEYMNKYQSLVTGVLSDVRAYEEAIKDIQQ